MRICSVKINVVNKNISIKFSHNQIYIYVPKKNNIPYIGPKLYRICGRWETTQSWKLKRFSLTAAAATSTAFYCLHHHHHRCFCYALNLKILEVFIDIILMNPCELVSCPHCPLARLNPPYIVRPTTRPLDPYVFSQPLSHPFSEGKEIVSCTLGNELMHYAHTLLIPILIQLFLDKGRHWRGVVGGWERQEGWLFLACWTPVIFKIYSC